MLPSGCRFFRSTALPDASVTVAPSTIRASALPRTTSETISGMWLCSTMCLTNSSGFWPGLLRPAEQVLGQLVLLDADLLGLDDLVEQELRGHRVADPLLELRLELVDGLPLVLEVGVHRRAGVRQLLVDLLASTGELLGHDGVGQRDLGRVEQLLEHGVAGGGGLLEALAALEPGGDVVAQLLDRVELRGGLGELVVEARELLLLDRGQRTR